jgi:hypothetical protein
VPGFKSALIAESCSIGVRGIGDHSKGCSASAFGAIKTCHRQASFTQRDASSVFRINKPY